MMDKVKTTGKYLTVAIFPICCVWSGERALQLWGLLFFGLICIHAALFFNEPNGQVFRVYDVVAKYAVGFIFLVGAILQSYTETSTEYGILRLIWPIVFIVIVFNAVDQYMVWSKGKLPQTVTPADEQILSKGDSLEPVENKSSDRQQYFRNVYHEVIADLQLAHPILNKASVLDGLLKQLSSKVSVTGEYDQDYRLLHGKVERALQRYEQTTREAITSKQIVAREPTTTLTKATETNNNRIKELSISSIREKAIKIAIVVFVGLFTVGALFIVIDCTTIAADVEGTVVAVCHEKNRGSKYLYEGGYLTVKLADGKLHAVTVNEAELNKIKVGQKVIIYMGCVVVGFKKAIPLANGFSQ